MCNIKTEKRFIFSLENLVAVMYKQWSSKLNFAWFLLDFDIQAVIKQWSSNEKIVKKSSRSAWFCLIMLDFAWSLLDHCLILLDYWTFCSEFLSMFNTLVTTPVALETTDGLYKQTKRYIHVRYVGTCLFILLSHLYYVILSTCALLVWLFIDMMFM